MPAPAWTSKAQKVLIPLAGFDLAVQYVAGILTNAYAPSGGFTDNTSFGWYDLHSANGFLLGFLLIGVMVVVGLTRQYPNLALAVIAFIAMLVASIAGMAFVGATPNPPIASATMGIAFLVAFGAMMMLGVRIRMPMGRAEPAPAMPTTSSPGV